MTEHHPALCGEKRKMSTVTNTLRKAGIVLIVICAAAVAAGGIFSHYPSIGGRVMAFSIGAEYLGRDGVVMQTRGKNCGAASLKMICDAYKISVSLHEIDSAVTTAHGGASMLALKTFAESKRLSVEGWKMKFDEFERRPFPMLLFVNNNHFVVADSVRDGEVFLRDPSIGRLKMSHGNIVKIWKGEALTFSDHR
jgi:predicted double-glycine peptidase